MKEETFKDFHNTIVRNNEEKLNILIEKHKITLIHFIMNKKRILLQSSSPPP